MISRIEKRAVGKSEIDGFAGGNQVQSRGFLNSYYEYGCSVCETPDSAFLVCGATSESVGVAAPEWRPGRDCRRRPYTAVKRPGQGDGDCNRT